MREIRMLRAMWRGLETEPRYIPEARARRAKAAGQQPRPLTYDLPRQPSTLPRVPSSNQRSGFQVAPVTMGPALDMCCRWCLHRAGSRQGAPP